MIDASSSLACRTPAARVAMVLFLACAACAGGPHVTVHALQDQDAFARLRAAIVGSWSTASGTRVSYRLVSNESALVETWTGASGAETLTVYHPDGDQLMLTHYCAQGNQARLWLVASEGAHFRFERGDASNVLADASVLTVLDLRVVVATLERTETYVDSRGTPEVTALRFDRVSP